MKQKFALTFVLISFALVFIGCSDDATPELKNDEFVPTQSDSLIYSGMFSSNAHPTSGEVEVYSDGMTSTLSFLNLKSDNGPDLRVYLSTSTGTSDFIEVGTLQAVTGNFSYELDASTDFTRYNHVLIWCEDFSVLFGHAVLQ